MPHLLELAGEIRNRIYRYALLVTSTPIDITANNFQQPPLLRTCPQIRNEAASI